ncbi:MAG: NAD(P)-dependent oxidoreductase [Candidatus Dormibacteraceae bacterium]
MKVAILGTGKMGAAMAKRLAAAGHELTLWNRTRQRAEALGIGEVASTPAEAVAGADVVISMLTDADAVRSAYLGEQGAVKAARSQVFVEMSTAGTDLAKDVAPPVEKAGASYVEAPVVGSIPAIAAGKSLVFAAGSTDAIERARPVLEAFGEVRRTGELGSAAALKLVANTMLMGVTALAAELQAAGAGARLEPEAVFSVISRLAPYLTARKAGIVEHIYEPVTFALRDAVKDLELATALYRRSGAATPLADETRRLYEQAIESAGELDMSAVATLYEKPGGKP